MTQEEKKQELRILNRKIRRIEASLTAEDAAAYKFQLDTLKRERKQLRQSIKQEADLILCNAIETATNLGFELECVNPKTQLYTITALWEYADGYKISKPAMPLEWCIQYLVGFADAEYAARNNLPERSRK